MTANLKVNGVGRDLSDTNPIARLTLNVYLNREYSDDEMRVVHDAIAEYVRLMQIDMPRLGDAELARREAQPSDALMPPEIEGLARVLFDYHHGADRPKPFGPYASWDETTDGIRARYRMQAEKIRAELSKRSEGARVEVTDEVVLVACNAYDSTEGVGQYLSDYPAMHAAITAAIAKMQGGG